MLYGALRATAAIALRWYYADVVVQGPERAPRDGPLVLVANHPNALIDPLLVGTALRRRVLLTAKATLFESPALAALLHAVGVVPLRRAKDESASGAATGASAESMRTRNAEAFRLVTNALLGGQAILVFPEGISHDDPSIAPLKSGAARMALQARDEGAVGLHVLSLGLIYEEKERPGSRVLVRIGDPLALDEWVASAPSKDASALTAELDARLREVTLNFATPEQAARAVGLAGTLVAIASTPATLDAPPSLDAEADVARRIERATSALPHASPVVTAAADVLTARLQAIERALERRGMSLSDVRISPRLRPGAWFVVREGAWAVLAGVAAVLGGWTHWIPLTLARRLALGSLRGDPSRDQPAMRTILLGIAFVLVWYGALLVLLVRWRGWSWAILAIAILFMTAHVHRRLHGRFRRAARRARTYLALRADPALQDRVIAEIDALLSDAVALERALEQRD
ncbi:MAG TPA: lysophospholipid acyltransferase family protein [Gemmatimonadaceae bacterium]|nr:lysophospholipid acyltransferase family protein [Gemmatimonadaceae bacterium]